MIQEQMLMAVVIIVLYVKDYGITLYLMAGKNLGPILVHDYIDLTNSHIDRSMSCTLYSMKSFGIIYICTSIIYIYINLNATIGCQLDVKFAKGNQFLFLSLCECILNWIC